MRQGASFFPRDTQLFPARDFCAAFPDDVRFFVGARVSPVHELINVSSGCN